MSDAAGTRVEQGSKGVDGDEDTGDKEVAVDETEDLREKDDDEADDEEGDAEKRWRSWSGGVDVVEEDSEA